jgi:hypothetical protein
MFSKVTARIGKTAAMGLIVTTIGLGLVGGTGAAHAQDNQGESAGASCFYGGVEYSEGSIIRMPNGALYKCKDGGWVFECAGCATSAAQRGTAVAKGGLQTLHMAP